MASGTTPGTVAHYVLDVVARAEKLASIPELNGIFRIALQILGVQLFAFIRMVELENRRNLQVLFGEGFSAWSKYYKRMEFADSDPVIWEIEHSSEPFYWTELMRKRTLCPGGQRVIDAAKKFQLYDGFVAPMRSADGALTYILFAGNGIDPNDDYARAGTKLLAHCYGHAGHRIYLAQLAHRNAGVLSDRQRECLRWVQLGKSSRDISAILSISANTVDEHIGKACERLKVRTRVQAVLEATRRGVELLDP